MSAHLLEFMSVPDFRHRPSGQIVVADPDADLTGLIRSWLQPRGMPFHEAELRQRIERLLNVTPVNRRLDMERTDNLEPTAAA